MLTEKRDTPNVSLLQKTVFLPLCDGVRCDVFSNQLTIFRPIVENIAERC